MDLKLLRSVRAQAYARGIVQAQEEQARLTVAELRARGMLAEEQSVALALVQESLFWPSLLLSLQNQETAARQRLDQEVLEELQKAKHRLEQQRLLWQEVLEAQHFLQQEVT